MAPSPSPSSLRGVGPYGPEASSREGMGGGEIVNLDSFIKILT